MFRGSVANIPTTVSAQKGGEDSEDTQQVEVADGVVARINNLIAAGVVNKDLANESIKVINDRLRDWRSNQDAIYAFARAVTRNIHNISCAADSCQRFKSNVIQTASSLLESSYADAIGQNANLSNQLKSRLPLLIEDSLKLGSDSHDMARKAFEDELNVIADRWLQSKRFRVGVGLNYTYLPGINFAGRERIDLSPFPLCVNIQSNSS